MDEFKLFIPITKVDVQKRLVYGTVASEMPDKSKESMDYESAKPEFAKWSDDISKATDGKSVGNMRVMHGNKVAGKFIDIAFDDTNRKIEMCGKVIDDAEWNMVLEGAYTGFSMGGSYLKRWADGDITRYTPRVAEVSLVDNPCIPDATFSVIKSDGSVEMKKFTQHKETDVKQPTNEQVAERAREMAKAAGDETKWASHVEAARAEFDRAADPETVAKADVPVVVEEKVDPAAPTAVIKAADPTEDFGVEQVWKAKDGTTFKKKAEALAHNEKLTTDEVVAKATAPVDAVLKEVSAALDEKLGKTDPPPAKKEDDAEMVAKGEGEEGSEDGGDKKDEEEKVDKTIVADGDKKEGDAEKVVAAVEVAKTKKPLGMKKGLWIISEAATLLSSINYLSEAFLSDQFWEGDMDAGGTIAQFKTWVEEGAKLLTMLVAEETSELIEGGDVDDAGALILELYAAPGKKHDAMIKLLGKSKIGLALEKAGARNSKKDGDRVQSMHDTSVELGAKCDSAEKVAGAELRKIAAERDGLAKAVEGFGKNITDVLERVKKIESTPMPGGPVRNGIVVNKGADSGVEQVDSATFEAQFAKMSDNEKATLLIKLSQQNGRKFGPQV